MNLTYILMLLIIVKNSIESGIYYEMKANTRVKQTVNPDRALQKQTRFECIAECNKADNCFVVEYDTDSSINCWLYQTYITDYEQSKTTSLFKKKIQSLLDFYRNYQESDFNLIAIPDIINFDISIQDGNNIFYYTTSDRFVNVYDINWNYLKSYEIQQGEIFYIKIVENDIYLSSNSSIYKTDSSFNSFLASKTSGSYREIFYYSKENKLYAANTFNRAIEVFDRELKKLNAINLAAGNTVHGISVFQDFVYLGTKSKIMVYDTNKLKIREFPVDCDNLNPVFSITIDSYGFMSVACENKGFFLYHINGSYLNLSIKMLSHRYISFDYIYQGVIIANNTLYYKKI